VYLAAMAGLILWQAGGQSAKLLHMLLPNVVHLQNYSIRDSQPVAKATWSLAVEEHFYLALPILLMLLARGGPKRMRAIPFIAAGLGIGCLALRLLHFGKPFEPGTQQFPTHLRIDSLFMGVLLAYWFHLRPHIFAAIARRRALLGVGALVLVAPMAVLVLKTPFVWTIGYTMLYLGYACLLVLFVSSQEGEGVLGRWLTSRPARALAWIGTFSYSIYLWHLDFIMHPIQRMCHGGWLGDLPHTVRWLVATGVYFAAAIGVGVILSKVIEYPVLALRNRLFPGRADALGRERRPAEPSVRETPSAASPAESLATP
jgi:peptidoglycan/LPS O-acetylase OafA/YrhL